MKTKRIRTLWRIKGYRKTKDGMYIKEVPCFYCKGSLTRFITDQYGYQDECACEECENGMMKDYLWTDALETKWQRRGSLIL